jgi:hypothetical protein
MSCHRDNVLVPIPRTLNHHFFKTWTSSMAYILGFFAADGCMIANKRGAHYIEFHITDRCILTFIRHAFGSNHKIALRRRGSRRQDGYRIQFGSHEMFADLIKLGFTQRKSLQMKLPVIPKRFFADFVRGYFDGDGCVYYARLKFADRKNPRKVFLTTFTSGCKDYLHELHIALQSHGIQGGSLHSKGKVGGYDLGFSHRDSLALYRLMYNTAPDTGFYLPRKYKIFRKAIRGLYPNMRE